MADKPIKPPGSITAPADGKNERIAEISNVNSAISKMQRKVNQQLSEIEVDAGSYEGMEDVQNSMIKVLGSLNSTVGSIGYGFAKIAAETTKASAGAIKQYGKAVTEDLRLNKQNVVAMALARSSPIFGYFAAKFVETDVFQNAKEKMKANISSALGGVTSKFKEGISGLIGRARRSGEKEKPLKRIKPKEEIPKMQTGGYVQKAGTAYLHPAEVVVPIEKILSRIDESIGVSKDLAKISKDTQLKTLAKVSTYVATAERGEKVGIFKGFIRALRQVQRQYTEPSNVRMLRAVLAIQDTLGATVGTWTQVWQKMLVEHPFFRNTMFAMKALTGIIGLPFKFIYPIFKSRGGYKSHLSTSSNPLQAIGENIGLIYAEGMWRLDNIALYTRATAEATRDLSSAITGKTYSPLEGIPRGIWSILGIARGLTNWATKNLSKIIFTTFGGSIKLLTKQKEFAELVSGLGTQIGDVLTKKYDLSPRKLVKAPFGKGVNLEDVYGSGKKYLGLGDEKIEQEVKRIGALPVSEIHIERLLEYAQDYMVSTRKDQRKLLSYTSDIIDINKDEYKITKRMDQREHRKSIFGFFGGAFGAIKNLIGAGIGFIAPLLSGFLIPAIKGLWSSLFPRGVVSAITGTVFSSITGLWLKIFPNGIISAITGALSGVYTSMFPGGIAATLTGTLASAPLWTSIIGAISSALAGYGLGNLLDKLIGVSEGFKSSLDRMDKRAQEASNIQTKALTEKFKRARGGGEKGFESLQELKLKTQFTTKERGQDIGYFGRTNILAIDAAQQKYMGEHINEYLQYGPEQIQFLRNKWIKEGGFGAKRVGYDPEKYGSEREKSFLDYVKKEGQPLSEKEQAASYEAYAHKYKDKFNLMDRAGGVVMDMNTIAKEGINAIGVQTKAIQEGLKQQGKEIKEGAEKLGQGISTSVTHATNAVTSSVQNVQHVVHNSTQRIRDIFSEYDYAVIKGDLDFTPF